MNTSSPASTNDKQVAVRSQDVIKDKKPLVTAVSDDKQRLEMQRLLKLMLAGHKPV